MAVTTTAALLGAATLGAGLLSSKASTKAANKAADVSQAATDKSLALQSQQYNQTRSDLQPYAQAGYGAIGALQGRLGVASPTPQQSVAQPGLVGASAETGAAGYGQGIPQAGPSDGGAAMPQQGDVASGAPQQPLASADPGSGGAAPGSANTISVNPQTYGVSGPPVDPGSFSFTPQDYKESPGLQFQLDQARKGIEASASARGAVHSGAAAAALQDRAQQIAYGDFANERQAALGIYNTNLGKFQDDQAYQTGRFDTERGYQTGRYDTYTNNLLNLTGIGQSAAAGTAAAGTNYTNAATNALQTNATTQANAGLVGASNTNQLLGTGLNAAAYAYGSRPVAGFGVTPAAAGASNALLSPKYASYGAA